MTSFSFGIDKNTKVLGINNPNKIGETLSAEIYLNNEWLPLPDPILKDPDFEISLLFCDEIEEDLDADKRLAKKYNFKIKYAIQQLNEIYVENNEKLMDNYPI